MSDADKWSKLEQIIRRVVEEALDARGLKAKAKIVFTGGRWSGITVEQMAAWSAAYPSLDLEAELKRAAAWVASNPHLAPKSQFPRFINHWLSKSHSTLSIRSIPTRSEPGPSKKLCEYCDKVATGSPNKTWACDDHFEKAMHHEPVPMFKNTVTPKNVTGER